MVDFRYHLVSLVSVFLALAVGIILGAGPLQNSIGNALSGQVDTLRESRDELRVQLDATTAKLTGNEQALQIAGSQLLPGSLEGRRVAIVVLTGADDDGTIEDQLKVAGATISGKVELTDAFSLSSQKTFRGALAGQVKDYIAGLADDATNDQIVASAIDDVLRHGATDSNSKVLLGSLTAENNAMLNVTQEITAAADAIVVIAPKTLHEDVAEGQQADPDKEAEANARTDLYAAAFATIAGRGPAVAYGTAADDTDVLAAIRSQKAGSTVDSAGSVAAALNAAFAVGNELVGEHVSLGTQKGAEAALGTRSDAAAPVEPPAPVEPATPEATPQEDQG